MASIDSQGTELFLSPLGTAVLRFPCPTGINGIGFSTDKKTSGCLDALVNTQSVGRKTLNDITVPFEVQKGDEAHQLIINTLTNPLVDMPFLVADSQGTDDPEIATGVWTVPTDREGFHGIAKVSNLTIDYSGGEDVKGSFTLTPSVVTPYFLA